MTIAEKNWREASRADFRCEKHPVIGAAGIAVTNHPLGTAAAAEMLAAGGNAVDAAVAALLTLTVVEPMMVGLVGGGMMHIRLPSGEHVVLDGQSQAPKAARADMFEPVSDDLAQRLEVAGRKNACGVLATATAGNLATWAMALERHGRFSLADVMAPAIRHAERGFIVSDYLSECTAESAHDLAKDAAIARLFLPNGDPVKAGSRLVQADYAATLRAIAAGGAAALHGGEVGRRVAAYMAEKGGILSLEDLAGYKPIVREPVRGDYRGVTIVGPPPPASGGIHVIEMLNILEGFDLAGMGFGSGDAIHLLAEVIKIAFADRDASTGDPAFLDVPVDELISKAYADGRRSRIDMAKSRSWAAGVPNAVGRRESPHTTHLTIIDRDGGVVAATHTINSLFGARYIIGDTGMIANNYMYLFDPHPGRALSIAPGKRVPTSMSPIMGVKDGEVQFALGLTGGVRIFPTAMQAVVNLVEHGMSLQEAVEAPRVWCQGGPLELETGIDEAVAKDLAGRGHDTQTTRHLGGGMCAVKRLEGNVWQGAACWRADGHAMAVGGGAARHGVRFWPESRRG
ncbi:MAG: gamma-glutamyltransferase [Hyphomicrobiaceae bacterium]